MKKSFVENLEKNHLFSDEFRTARSIVVVLTTKSHSIGEAPDDKHNSKSIALYISKGFEKVWNKYLQSLQQWNHRKYFLDHKIFPNG